MEKALILLLWLVLVPLLRGQTNGPPAVPVDPGQGGAASQPILSGGTRKVSVPWKALGGEMPPPEIRGLIFQCSSGTVMPLGETPWETPSWPRQPLWAEVPVEFPAVRGQTRFIVRWHSATNQFLGTTEVEAYPTNLLGELKPLLRQHPLGVLDPDNELKPLLKQNGVNFLDLADSTLDGFQGRLALVGPFHRRAQLRPELMKAILKAARAGSAIVWLLPPREHEAGMKPSFYVVPEGKGAVVVVQPDVLANLANDPKAQLNLVYLCKLALNPEPFSISNLADQP